MVCNGDIEENDIVMSNLFSDNPAPSFTLYYESQDSHHCSWWNLADLLKLNIEVYLLKANTLIATRKRYRTANRFGHLTFSLSLGSFVANLEVTVQVVQTTSPPSGIRLHITPPPPYRHWPELHALGCSFACQLVCHQFKSDKWIFDAKGNLLQKLALQ